MTTLHGTFCTADQRRGGCDSLPPARWACSSPTKAVQPYGDSGCCLLCRLMCWPDHHPRHPTGINWPPRPALPPRAADTHFALDFVQPEQLTLRMLMRSLGGWGGVRAGRVALFVSALVD